MDGTLRTEEKKKKHRALEALINVLTIKLVQKSLVVSAVSGDLWSRRGWRCRVGHVVNSRRGCLYDDLMMMMLIWLLLNVHVSHLLWWWWCWIKLGRRTNALTAALIARVTIVLWGHDPSIERGVAGALLLLLLQLW